MFGACDDLVLQFLGQITEVVAVAGHAHDQIAIRIGFGLGFPQRLGADHIELHVVAFQAKVAAHQVRQFVDAVFIRQQAGVNFMFSSVPPVLT